MRKLFLTLAICALMCILLVVGASAAQVTDDGSNMTLGNCTIADIDKDIPAPTRGLVYELDFSSKTATVKGKGSFAGGNLVIPSTVTYDGHTYDVKTVAPGTFNGGSNSANWLTYSIYVPDSVTRLGGGGSSGCFGNSNLRDVYIGCGLTEIEQETFSGSKGVTAFVLKSKVTKIGKYAFNSLTKGSEPYTAFELDFSQVTYVETVAFSYATFVSGIDFEFTGDLEFIGETAFLNSGLSGIMVVPEDCNLGYRCLNGSSFDLVVINVTPGTTRDLPQELFSGASGGLTVVFNGGATTAKPHLLSGNDMKIFMPTKAQIQTLATAIAGQSNASRLTKVTFYSCEDGEKYSCDGSGNLGTPVETDEHGYTVEPVVHEENCTYTRQEAYVCYCCGYEDVVFQGTELGDHVFDKKVKAPSCQSMGYTEYYCTVCGFSEVKDFVDMTSHSNTVVKYGATVGSNLEIITSCQYCGTVDNKESVSLVGKCYIEGYGLFDATLDYVSVSADGTLTPSGATFDKAVIYFPSFVKVGDKIVEVKTLSGFKEYSVSEIYVPDTVTRIAGGGGTGCFGDCFDLKVIVVGKGVTKLEQEVFCMANEVKLEKFIFKGTITDIRTLALQMVSSYADGIPYEFNTYLSYVGSKVNVKGNIIKEAHVAKNCDLSERFAFNDANGLLSIYIEGGDTPETALDLGQEFTSNTKTQFYYIKGYVTVSGQAVIGGVSSTRIFMTNTDAIDLFASAIKSNGFSSRINNATFVDCSTGKTWWIKSDSDRAQHSVPYTHAIIYVETEGSCTQVGTKVEKCFVCDKIISTEESESLGHSLDGGVITKMPDCKNLGTIVYTCINCKQTDERSIFNDYSKHEYVEFIAYVNGFGESGERGDKCEICQNKTNITVIEAIIEALGYAIKNDRTGIDGGYKLNSELLSEYERINGKIKFGVIIVNAEDASTNGLVDTDFLLLSKKGIQVEIGGEREYDHFNLSIMGFATDDLKALNLLITSYVIADLDGDGDIEISYVQYEMPDKDNQKTEFGSIILNTVSIDRACPPTEAVVVSGKDE